MIWVLIYFPNKPPTPPSPSAALSVDGVETTVKAPSFFREVLILCKHRSFMILSIVGGYSTGLFVCFSF